LFKLSYQRNRQIEHVVFNRGNALDKLGRFQEAVECYNEAILRDPDYAQAYLNRGFVLEKLGRYSDAVTSMRRGHGLGSSLPNWRYPSQKWLTRMERLKQLADLVAADEHSDNALEPEDQIVSCLILWTKGETIAAASGIVKSEQAGNALSTSQIFRSLPLFCEAASIATEPDNASQYRKWVIAKFGKLVQVAKQTLDRGVSRKVVLSNVRGLQTLRQFRQFVTWTDSLNTKELQEWQALVQTLQDVEGELAAAGMMDALEDLNQRLDQIEAGSQNKSDSQN
jgi:tetratricopeptide (TPR) repeat protein